jgi:putative ABC transport system permease protein
MMRVALRGLAGRKLRSLLTAIAIVLGVAMVSGTYVLTDTINRAFDTIFSESYAGTDAVVTGGESDISFQGSTADTPPVPAGVLERVRATEGVESAVGSIADDTATKVLDREGDAVETGGAPTFGFGIDASQSRFNPLQLNSGRWPSGPNEVVLDAGTADDESYTVGDTVRISTLKPVQPFEIVGLAQYGDVESLGGATFAVFDIPTAQRLLEREGELDAIQVAAEAGVTPEQLVQNLRGDLPQGVSVQTGQAQADEDSEEISTFTSFIRYFLLSFAVVALFVGAFVIFNTLSITVAQRTREFATVRTIGGSRRQVLAAVLVEALVVGLLASVLGLFSGFGLAAGLRELFAALNLDLPATGLVFATRTVVVSMLVGVIVTLVAGLAPAIRATKVPPIAAVREGAELPHGRFARVWPWVAGVITALGVLLLGYSLFADDIDTAQRLLSIAGGVLSLFVGVALLSPRLVRPLARVVGWPATRIGGVAGRLAQGNSMRNPGRTAATAAALMIGIALVTFVSVLAEGMRTSNSEAIKRQIRADFVITSQDGYTPFVAGAGEAARDAEGASVVTDVRTDLAEVAGSDRYVTGIDPENVTAGYRFEWKEGSDAVLGELGRTGAIVAEDFADEKELAVGDAFPLRTAGGQRTQLVVEGIYTPPPFYPLLGSVSVSTRTFDSLYERKRNQYTFANFPGGPTEAGRQALEAAVASFPDARVQTRAEWIEKEDREFQQFLSLLYVLLALSVIVSIFGIVNTLVLSIYERTRELGMLRAVGMTRRQVRRMVRHESVITALIGASLGLPLGVFLAALMTRALDQFDVQFVVPTVQLIVLAVVAIFVGMLAAILPARRAARLNVLQALQYE